MSTSAVIIYANGLLSCSVCAPKRFTAEEVEADVNAQSPAGTEHGWRISKDKAFASGAPNPCEYNDPGSDRLHWLMDC